MRSSGSRMSLRCIQDRSSGPYPRINWISGREFMKVSDWVNLTDMGKEVNESGTFSTKVSSRGLLLPGFCVDLMSSYGSLQVVVC